MSGARQTSSLLLAAALLLACAGRLDAAPPASGPPNALQGFSQNQDQPVHIEAATLVVRDKDKIATFSGDVNVTQGDTNMRCKTLVVFYEQAGDKSDSKSMKVANPGPGGEQRIKKLEARGSVVVTRADQTATGDTGLFDMPSNTVTLSGNVVMTQGKSVLRGDKLVVNLTSGVSRVELGKRGRGRVQGLFIPSAAPNGSKPGGAGASPPSPLPVQPFRQ